jgi:hypothetical protein
MNIERDRRELTVRLASTLTDLRRFSGAPIPEARQTCINDAFDACANCGIFNREHPNRRIEPIKLNGG